MLKRIDVNADCGESYGNFKVGNDQDLFPYLTSCNLACGFHGGDPMTIKRTIDLALENDLSIGAHPSYPDLQGFGRRKIDMSLSELTAIIQYQVHAVKGLVEMQGGQLKHVKPHGALNNAMAKDAEMLLSILSAVGEVDPNLVVYVPYTDQLEQTDQIRWEMFADRTYESDLTLTPRSRKGSLITDLEVAKNHLLELFKSERIISSEGIVKEISIDTLCIHGDNMAALEIAKLTRSLASELDIKVQSVQ